MKSRSVRFKPLSTSCSCAICGIEDDFYISDGGDRLDVWLVLGMFEDLCCTSTYFMGMLTFFRIVFFTYVTIKQ